MFRTQVRVKVTVQVQQLLSLAAIELGIDRSTYLQAMMIDALNRDLDGDYQDMFPPPSPQSSVARSKIGGLRKVYRQSQPKNCTISFMTYAPCPATLHRAAQETGMQTITAYVRRELQSSLAWILDMDPDEIQMPKNAAEMIHPIFGEGTRNPVEDVPNTHLLLF